MAFEEAEDLVRQADAAADRLADVEGTLRCVAHYDCDGISSAVIVKAACDRADIPVQITFVDELDREKLEGIEEDTFEPVVLFVDIGSGQIAEVADVMADREVIIADHHEPGEGEVAYHVNPHTVGIDGGKDISGAGVTYLLMRCLGSMNSEHSLDRENSESSPSEDNRDLIKYALVGATGDIQTDGDEYLGLNASMMEDAAEMGVIEKKKGLRLYGRTRKTIVESFKYTTDPYLPGISNSESGAVQFLSESGIELRENGDFRSLEDLSLEEEQQLVHQLIMDGYDVAELLGDIYMLDNGWEISEFASLMNACGRLEQPEAGLKICLEDDYELARKLKRDYGRKIGSYLSYVEDNMDDSDVVHRLDAGAVIDARDNIHANMIGTITTICQRSGIVEADVLVGMAHKGDDHIKLSARASQAAIDRGLVMSEVMQEVCTVCEGDGGGHEAAAGGMIPRSERDRFIKMMREVLATETVEV